MSYYFLFHEDDDDTKTCGHIADRDERFLSNFEKTLRRHIKTPIPIPGLGTVPVPNCKRACTSGVNYFAQRNINLVLHSVEGNEDQSDTYGEKVTLDLLKRNSGPDCHVALDGYGMSTAGGTPLQMATTYERLATYVHNSWLDT